MNPRRLTTDVALTRGQVVSKSSRPWPSLQPDASLWHLPIGKPIVLFLIYLYRTVTLETLQLVYTAETGEGGAELPKHLRALTEAGLIRRHLQPHHDRGRKPYVYTLLPSGVRDLPVEVPDQRLKRCLHNAGRQRHSGYTPLLKEAEFHALWNLGSRKLQEAFSTIAYWRDGDIEFTARQGGTSSKLIPDSTILLNRYTHTRPVFVEVDMSRKNKTRFEDRLYAYHSLLMHQQDYVTDVFERHAGFPAGKGIGLFLVEDPSRRDAFRERAARYFTGIRPKPHMAFVSLTDLRDGRGRGPLIQPETLFSRPMALRLSGHFAPILEIGPSPRGTGDDD